MLKNKIAFIWLLVFAVLSVLLQTGYAYSFFFTEQSQVFLFTSAFAVDVISRIGGLADYLSFFLVQFYVEPYIGPLTLSLLLTLASCYTYKILSVFSQRRLLLILSLLPMVFFLIIQMDNNCNYNMAGIMAYLIMLVVANGYRRISSFKVRIVTTFVLSPILYFGIGPTAMLLFIYIFFFEWHQKRSRGWISLIFLAETCVIAYLSVYTCRVEELRIAFLPDFYYHHWVHPPFVIYWSWIVFILIFPVAVLLDRFLWTDKKINVFFSYGLQLLCLSGIGCWGMLKYNGTEAKFTEADYYIRTGQWDKVESLYKGEINNLLYLCQLNTALIHNGRLADEMFRFDQKGKEGLLLPWNKMEVSSVLLSDIYFELGINSASHQYAFEGYVSGHHNGNVRMLKRLVQCNLVDGAYPAAEKFIWQLERTYAYREWAHEQRKFLYHDERVENDSVLGKLKRSLPDTTALWSDGYENNLNLLIENNPSNKAFIEFLGCYYLLSKDLSSFKNLLEKYYGKEELPVLPRHFQEAVLLAYENDVDAFKRYKIPIPMLDQFLDFRRQLLAGKNRLSAAPLLYRSYGGTFWFYLIFK